MIGESNKNVFLIHIDALSFAEFEISEFEISRVYCILYLDHDNYSDQYLDKIVSDKIVLKTL